MSITAPQFFSFFSKSHEIEYKHLKGVIKILRNDAVLKSTSYCLFFDINKQQMMVSEENTKGECSDEFLKEPKALRKHIFHEDLILQEARHAGSNYLLPGTSTDLLEVNINSSGFVTPFFLLFSSTDSSAKWKIESKGIMGKLLLNEYD